MFTEPSLESVFLLLLLGGPPFKALLEAAGRDLLLLFL